MNGEALTGGNYELCADPDDKYQDVPCVPMKMQDKLLEKLLASLRPYGVISILRTLR